MKLYLISQNKNTGYDTYDSAVVCCENEEEARYTHPDEIENWDGDGKARRFDTWCSAKYVHVEYIGIADSNIPKGVVCASFNAG